jgi:hypothetical protein
MVKLLMAKPKQGGAHPSYIYIFIFINSINYGSGWWFFATENMTSSVGMMTFPTEWEDEIHVPNHHTLSHFNLRVASGSNATRLWGELVHACHEHGWKLRVPINQRQCVNGTGLSPKSGAAATEHPLINKP